MSEKQLRKIHLEGFYLQSHRQAVMNATTPHQAGTQEAIDLSRSLSRSELEQAFHTWQIVVKTMPEGEEKQMMEAKVDKLKEILNLKPKE